jgi:transcriptional regulator with XRE-family HTH domain
MLSMAKLLIDQALKKRKLSKRQFAKKLGIQYSAVFRYFREGYDPKLSMLESWAKVLDCRIRDLYEE